MTILLEPSFVEAVFTIIVSGMLVAVTAACLWLLPWTDRSIRRTDKLLNPIDLTREDLALQRLVLPGTQLQ